MSTRTPYHSLPKFVGNGPTYAQKEWANNPHAPSWLCDYVGPYIDIYVTGGLDGSLEDMTWLARFQYRNLNIERNGATPAEAAKEIEAVLKEYAEWFKKEGLL